MVTLTTFIQYSIGSPRHSNQTIKRNKRNPDWKKVKLSLFTDDMILYIEYSKDATKKLLELINEFTMNSVELQDTKLIYRNLLHCYTLIMNY